MTDNMANKPLEKMNLVETERFLSVLRDARKKEYQALKSAWENPTPKQSRHLEKLRKRLQEVRAHHQKLKALISIYGSGKEN